MPLFCYTEEWEEAKHFILQNLFFFISKKQLNRCWLALNSNWTESKIFFEYVLYSINFQFACKPSDEKIAQEQCKIVFWIILSLLCKIILWIVPYHFCNVQSGLVIFGSRNLLNTLDKS